MDTNLHYLNPFHMHTPYLFTLIITVRFHLCLDLSSGLFLSGIKTKILCVILISHLSVCPKKFRRVFGHKDCTFT